MKTLSAFVLIAAPVAFVVYQFSFQVSVSLLFGAGLVAIAIGDYRRPELPLAAPRETSSARVRRQRLRLAA